ncbi:hypothetical protein AMTRI_Chr03g45990 [Amborella trichopoda]
MSLNALLLNETIIIVDVLISSKYKNTKMTTLAKQRCAKVYARGHLSLPSYHLCLVLAPLNSSDFSTTHPFERKPYHICPAFPNCTHHPQQPPLRVERESHHLQQLPL